MNTEAHAQIVSSYREPWDISAQAKQQSLGARFEIQHSLSLSDCSVINMSENGSFLIQNERPYCADTVLEGRLWQVDDLYIYQELGAQI